VDSGGVRSAHPDVKDPPGRTPLKEIKLIPDDAAGLLPKVEEIKKKYAALFGGGK
jgi:iron(III) transport system substrate-binding protein